MVGTCTLLPINRKELDVLSYRVDDMTCGHCANAITMAVREMDAGAQVQVDLTQHLVRVASNSLDATDIRKAIADAGYSPVPVA
jgi:copper chaperone